MGEKMCFKNVEGKFAQMLLPSIAALKDGLRRPVRVFLHVWRYNEGTHVLFIAIGFILGRHVFHFGDTEVAFRASAGAHCQQFCLAWKCWGCSAAGQPCPKHAMQCVFAEKVSD